MKLNNNTELYDIAGLFFDNKPASFEIIDSSRGNSDFREAVIITFDNGRKAVIKLADNDFTFPEKIFMWQKTIDEYIALGYYCPKIFTSRAGDFPTVSYKGRSCVAYAEEFAPYKIVDDFYADNKEFASARDYNADEAWIMTAKIAAKYLSYTDYPSGYCLFETFCPSDKTDEVLEQALKWKSFAETLPDEFQPQINRIWKLWTDNRNALEPLYKQLPTSIFQADLNSTNVLIDDNGNFIGVFDFNLCGKDVFLNYMFRETNSDSHQKELDAILNRCKLVSKHYKFSDNEIKAAPMIYRCAKPLYNYADKLKRLKDNKDELTKFLDETELFLKKDIDFASYMK